MPSDDLSAVVLFDPPGDADVRGIAAALSRELVPNEEDLTPLRGASPIALPVPDRTPRLDAADVVVALDLASAVRAREVGARRVVLLTPRFAVEDAAQADADLVLVTHDALAVDAARAARSCGPIAPEGWTPPRDREVLRRELNLGATGPWVVVRAAAIDKDPAAALVQLSLVRAPCLWLFDVGADAELARALRRRVPGYGLDAVMFADGPEALRCYQAADAVLGALDGPEAMRALATGAAFVALPPRADQVRVAHALESEGIADVADASATLAVTLDRALDPSALARSRSAGARLDAPGGARRAAELVRKLVRGELDARGASGLPLGIERLSEREAPPRSEPPPTLREDLDATVNAELAALRKKLGL
jgi:hypothetical protein